jgi:hypothetical protein
MPALLRANLVEVVDGVQARMAEAVHAGRTHGGEHALGAPAGERAGVGAEVELVRQRAACQARQLPLGRAVPEDERAVEPRVEVRQAVEHELGARPGRVAAAQQPIVEAEHRHHPLAAVERGPQGGMVVHAQVAREPDEPRHAPIGASSRSVFTREPR